MKAARPHRRSYGFIHRENLPLEVYRTERPLARFLRRLSTRLRPKGRGLRRGLAAALEARFRPAPPIILQPRDPNSL